jgi:uncharacterized protein YcbK (DUF882 family)
LESKNSNGENKMAKEKNAKVKEVKTKEVKQKKISVVGTVRASFEKNNDVSAKEIVDKNPFFKLESVRWYLSRIRTGND